MEQQRQYVGIDLHRRRSVIVRMTEDGEVLSCVRIMNDPVALSLELASRSVRGTCSWSPWISPVREGHRRGVVGQCAYIIRCQLGAAPGRAPTRSATRRRTLPRQHR